MKKTNISIATVALIGVALIVFVNRENDPTEPQSSESGQSLKKERVRGDHSARDERNPIQDAVFDEASFAQTATPVDRKTLNRFFSQSSYGVPKSQFNSILP